MDKTFNKTKPHGRKQLSGYVVVMVLFLHNQKSNTNYLSLLRHDCIVRCFKNKKFGVHLFHKAKFRLGSGNFKDDWKGHSVYVHLITLKARIYMCLSMGWGSTFGTKRRNTSYATRDIQCAFHNSFSDNYKRIRNI